MAYVNDIQSATPAFSGFGGIFKTVAEKVARYRVYRETFAELDTLSDRELSDLGLSRSAVRTIAHEAAYSK